MIPYYYYQGQIRKYLLQLCGVFSGLKVQTGKGECDVPEFITVPVRIGSRDRVVAAIESGNTQNKPFSVPLMALHMTNLAMSTARKGVGVVDRRVFLPKGGIYPTDLQSVTRVMPIPYTMNVELGIYASNTNQLHQILEQLLVLFDPSLQIQTTDAAFDWTKITDVTLTGLNNEENYAPGADRRILMWTMSFEVPVYMSAPMDIRDEVVRKILIRIGDLDDFSLMEFDENGNLVPFVTGELTRIEIDGT